MNAVDWGALQGRSLPLMVRFVSVDERGRSWRLADGQMYPGTLTEIQRQFWSLCGRCKWKDTVRCDFCADHVHSQLYDDRPIDTLFVRKD